MKLPLYMCLALPIWALPVAAQTLVSVTLEPAQVTAGQSVTARVTLDNTDNPNCGLRLRWGDGTQDNIKVEERAAVLSRTHTYAKAGDYAVVVEPGRVDSRLKCAGKNQTAMLKVLAVTPVPAPAAAAKPSGPACPAGWALNAKSVVKKTGAYTCSAKAGTELPKERTSCPGDLSYFENAKKGQLGCRP